MSNHRPKFRPGDIIVEKKDHPMPSSHTYMYDVVIEFSDSFYKINTHWKYNVMTIVGLDADEIEELHEIYSEGISE